LPEWELAVNASARGRVDTDALGAWRDASSLIGLVPVISMWRAYKIPLPALVSADPYGTLCTPLLDRDMAEEAVTGILQQARQAGAHALIFRATSLDGAAMKAFSDVLRRDGMAAAGAAIACPRLPRRDGDADEMLRDALGAKKLKNCAVSAIASPNTVLSTSTWRGRPPNDQPPSKPFLMLEASGWKGQRGTALSQDDGDAAFVRRATSGLGRDRPVRDRDPAGRRNAGGRRPSCCAIRTAPSTSSSASTSALQNFRRACS
jgi:hypothetical protein